MQRPVAVLILIATSAVCSTAVAVGPVPLFSPLSPFDGGGVSGLTLKTQLQKGLKARRPVEFEYIDQIIELVDKGKLPRKLVVTTYLAAQMRTRHPLQYFQLALQARARGLNVQLPNLRLQAVGISGNGGTHGVNTPPIPPF